MLPCSSISAASHPTLLGGFWKKRTDVLFFQSEHTVKRAPSLNTAVSGALCHEIFGTWVLGLAVMTSPVTVQQSSHNCTLKVFVIFTFLTSPS